MAVEDTRPDGDLARQAAAGDTAAFEALYRRHAPAAWRVASAVAANPHDAADAVSDAFTRVLAALAGGRLDDGVFFRSYLLTATRNAALDLHRRSGRVRSTDRLEHLDVPAGGRTAGERVDDHHDAALVATAFRGLPERWRSVLWLTEVEGASPREVGALLGLTANTAAQLAVRARAGLRERFVQAHLRLPVDAACQLCVHRLGGYVTGSLSPRELAKVDQHLAGCAACRDRAKQLEDLGMSLRRVVLPLPLLLGPAALEKWKLAAAASSASTATAGAVGSGGGWSSEALSKFHRPLVVASTGIFALGVISASVVGSAPDLPGGGTRRAPVTAVAPTPPHVVEDVALVGTRLPDGLSLDSLSESAAPDPGSDSASPPAGGAAGGAERPRPGPGGDAPAPNPPPPSPPPEPTVNVAASVFVGGQPIGLSAGVGEGSCTGGALTTLRTGCPPPPPPQGQTGLAIETDGSAGGGVLRDRSVVVAV